MKRRNFLTSLLGLLGLAAVPVVAKSAPVEKSFTYDWSGNFTDDPRYAAEWPIYSPRCHVTLDGRNVDELRVKQLKTGKDGWIEFQKLDAEGNYFHETTDRRTGKVVLNARWKVFEKLPDGELWECYDVELATGTLRGVVTFEVVEAPLPGLEAGERIDCRDMHVSRWRGLPNLGDPYPFPERT